MKIPFERFYLPLSLAVALIMIATLAPIASSARAPAGRDAVPPSPADDNAVADDPSLHNPTFDNHIWYEFHRRHATSYPKGVWVPDGNWYRDPQDWRLWFLHETGLVDCDPHTGDKHSGTESAQFRTFNWDAHQVAGLYQVVQNTTPCLTYQFQMYGKSRQKETDDYLGQDGLKVGIEQTGWELNPDHRPAVHSWPTTMVWGTSHKYTTDYGPLMVTAEALETQITVFTYADAYGGNSHKIHWDTGSFQEIAPSELVSDPNSPPDPGGISNLQVITNSTSATVSWNTSREAISQVYYRLIAGPSTPVPPPGTLLLHTIYLPLVSRAPNPWFSTDLDKSYEDSHSVVIGGLQPGSTYEYFVASRGVSGDACVTWVSDKEEFTTDTAQ